MPLGVAKMWSGMLLLHCVLGVLATAPFLSPAPGFPGVLQQYEATLQSPGNSDRRTLGGQIQNRAGSQFLASDFTLPEMKPSIVTPPAATAQLNSMQSVDTAVAAIQPLTDIMADTTQTQKNSEHTIGVYQDTLEKMFREVTAQKESVGKSKELIEKLQKLHAENEKILTKNQATVKKYSEGLVDLVTQYTTSLSSSPPEGGKEQKGEAGEKKEEFLLEKLSKMKQRASAKAM